MNDTDSYYQYLDRTARDRAAAKAINLYLAGIAIAVVIAAWLIFA